VIRSIPSRIWTSPSSYLRFQLPISRWSVPGSVSYEAQYHRGPGDAVAEMTDTLIRERARFEEHNLLLSCPEQRLLPEAAFPCHLDPNLYALGGLPTPPMEANTCSYYGLLCQMAMAHSGATFRVSSQDGLLDGVVDLLLTMIAERDALPNVLAMSHRDAHFLQHQIVQRCTDFMLMDAKGHGPFRLEEHIERADPRLTYRAWGNLSRNRPPPPLDIPIICGNELPVGHVFALSYAWPAHWREREFLIQEHEEFAIETYEMQGDALLTLPPTGPSTNLIAAGSGAVCCHAPFLQGWLEIRS